MVLPACGSGFQQRSHEERESGVVASDDNGAVGNEEGGAVVD
jgi:hypothetical protein